MVNLSLRRCSSSKKKELPTGDQTIIQTRGSPLTSASLHSSPRRGFTSLFFHAVNLGDEDVILLLLLKYAKPTDYNSRDGHKNTAMHIAAKRGFVTVLGNLLKHCDTGVNAENDKKKTPLFYAAEAGHFGAIEALLKYPVVEQAKETAEHETAKPG